MTGTMTRAWRLVIVAIGWVVVCALLTLAVASALNPEPCVEDGVVTNREACE